MRPRDATADGRLTSSRASPSIHHKQAQTRKLRSFLGTVTVSVWRSSLSLRFSRDDRNALLGTSRDICAPPRIRATWARRHRSHASFLTVTYRSLLEAGILAIGGTPNLQLAGSVFRVATFSLTDSAITLSRRWILMRLNSFNRPTLFDSLLGPCNIDEVLPQYLFLVNLYHHPGLLSPLNRRRYRH